MPGATAVNRQGRERMKDSFPLCEWPISNQRGPMVPDELRKKSKRMVALVVASRLGH